MEQIPVELWHKIGEYACLDGGLTGCSLSLVSHATRTMTEGVRYTSVALTSQKSCFAFARSLNHFTFHPAIRHLLISFDAHPTVVDISLTRREDLLDKACLRILALTSPTLVTLVITLHRVGYNNLAIRSGLHFPRLLDLYIPTLLRRLKPEPPARPSTFPVLERLHTSGSAAPDALELWEHIAELAPSVETVRLSNVDHNKLLPPLLCILLDLPVLLVGDSVSFGVTTDYFTPHIPRATAIAAKLPNLKHIIVQPYKDAASFIPSHSTFMQAIMSILLNRIVKATLTNARRLWVAEAASRMYGNVQAREDWLDVVSGGTGAWALAPDPASMQLSSSQKGGKARDSV